MKLSFFDRLSGGPSATNGYDAFDEEMPIGGMHAHKEVRERVSETAPRRLVSPEDDTSSSSEGQLPVDVHQTSNEIIVRAFVAGVRPDELNISIGRDMIEIEGSRMERGQIAGPDYFTRELFWGSFSRTIMLPQEIDVDASSASAKDGLLTLILPKIDKKRQTKLRVKVG